MFDACLVFDIFVVNMMLMMILMLLMKVKMLELYWSWKLAVLAVL